MVQRGRIVIVLEKDSFRSDAVLNQDDIEKLSG